MFGEKKNQINKKKKKISSYYDDHGTFLRRARYNEYVNVYNDMLYFVCHRLLLRRTWGELLQTIIGMLHKNY